MSGPTLDETAAAAVTSGVGAAAAALPAADSPTGWWQAWRARFGLAEVCGTAAAAAGFAVGYLQAGSLLAAAALATVCEAVGFYGCIGAKTVAAARRATTHLDGWRRLAAGVWHAVREQLASCAVAEAADGFLIRPGCLVGAAWLMRPLPGGVWLGFVAGKAAADVAWYGLEAYARRGVAWSVGVMKSAARAPLGSPRLAAAGEVAQRVDVLGLVDVAWRGGEGGIRPHPDNHPVLLAGHPLDLGPLVR